MAMFFLKFAAKLQKIFGFRNTYMTFFIKKMRDCICSPSKIHIFCQKIHLFLLRIQKSEFSFQTFLVSDAGLTSADNYLKADGTTRANICAGSALCANVRINRIVFTFRDSAHRALVNTCTASNAVCRNLVSHDTSKFMIYNL